MEGHEHQAQGRCPVNANDRDARELIASMSDEEVERTLLELVRHMNEASAWMHVAVAEFDRRRIADREYVLSTKQWLTRFARVSATKASRIRRTATALDAMPDVMKNALSGAIQPEAMTSIASARHEHPDAFPLHEPVFADIATYLPAADLRTAIGHWSQQVSLSEGHDDAATQRDRRHLSVNQTFEGMWRVSGLLDAESGSTLSTALRSRTDPTNLDPDDGRTHGQKTADAASDVARFWLDHNDTVLTSGGEKPHVTVVVGYEELTAGTGRVPDLDGTPVSRDTIRRLACDAGIVRIVVDGDGQPLDVGRKVRTVTPAIRRALDLRDGGCTWDGCDAPVGWCDAHHIIHWADGGSTTLANMTLLCRSHHTAVHEGRIARHRPMSHDPPGTAV